MFDGEDYARVVKAKTCNGLAGPMEGSSCVPCRQLMKNKAFRMVVLRLKSNNDKGCGGRARNWKNWRPAELRDELRKLKRKEIDHIKANYRLRFMFLKATGKIKQRPITEAAVEHAKGRDIRKLLEDIKEMREEGTFKDDKAMAISVATDILKNASAMLGANGRRYSDDTIAWLGVMRTNAGPRVFNMVSNNAGLSHERSARLWAQNKRHYACQGTDADFCMLAQTYEAEINRHGIPLGSVPVTLATDETRITPKMEYDVGTNSIVGYCGRKCDNECDTAK